jgi:glycosyltransferase 2 family protein
MRGRRTRAAVGIALTAVFLYLALRGVDWREVGTHLREADYLLLGAAVLVATLGIHVRALRWGPLLRPVAPGIALPPRVAGVAIGLAANNVFPARVGEFARTWVLARQARIPVTAALASVVMERMLDAVILLTILLGVMASPAFPGLAGTGDFVQTTLRVVIALSAVLLAVLLSLALFPVRAVAVAERLSRALLPEAFRRPVVDALHAFVGGLHVLRSPRLLGISLLWAVGQWAFLALSFLLAFRAFGITEPGYLGALFLQSAIGIAVAIPSAPGFFGPFHAAAVWGLGIWGVEQARAASFAIGFHLGGWVAVTAVGAFHAARLNVRLRDLERSEEEVEEEVEEAVGGAERAEEEDGGPPR